MNETWAALARYRLLEQRVNDLKRRAWMNVPSTQEIEGALEEAEQELAHLKAWIELNFEVKKLD